MKDIHQIVTENGKKLEKLVVGDVVEFESFATIDAAHRPINPKTEHRNILIKEDLNVLRWLRLTIMNIRVVGKVDFGAVNKENTIDDFRDSEFMTAVQKLKTYRKFKTVIEKRDISLMDRNLYQHLNLRCGFIAHYDMDGFKRVYSSHGFLDFCDHFMRGNHIYYGEYSDVNKAIKLLVVMHIDNIRQEFQDKVLQDELKLLHTLAEKHGVKVIDPRKVEQKALFCTTAQG